jgi:uncharacterized hydrophobic protein (TIGR00271 family)
MTDAPRRVASFDATFTAGGRQASRPAAAGGVDSGDESDRSDAAHGRALILANVARDARLDQRFVLLIVLSASIATLGLLQSSSAVVIGAMLVSPLLGPIMGIGFGLATLDSVLIKRAIVTLAAGMALAILVAVAIIWLSPMQDVTPELRARTQPTLLDLGVAVVGGVAGVYAIMRKLSGVMVGVAIATALVPPLSTVGFGLATGRMDFALGASLLFLTNTLAIAFAATVVARLNRFGPSLTPQHTAMQVVGIVASLGLLSIPLALSLNGIVQEVRARAVVQNVLEQAIGGGGRIDTLTVNAQRDTVVIDTVLLVDRFDPGLRSRLMTEVREQLGRPVSVTVAQLRRESLTGAEQQDSIVQRLSALERRDSDTQSLLRTLTIGDLISRDQITIDVQARRILVDRPGDDADQVAEAVNRVLARARADHPDWLIEAAVISPQQPDASEP